MIHSESLLALVRLHSELWDYGNLNYSNKKWKAQIWISIAEKLCVPVAEAKSHWTNLRDMFRRDVQKCLRKAKETGDPNVPEPRWRHFKSMLFLKDHITKDEMLNSIQFIDASQFQPQTNLDDVSVANGSTIEEESDSGPSHQVKAIIPPAPQKRAKDSKEEQHHTPTKRHRWDDECCDAEDYDSYDASRCADGMDEDYHFLMSILSAVRRVRQDRKTSFKMKVLQLIMEEENAEST